MLRHGEGLALPLRERAIALLVFNAVNGSSMAWLVPAVKFRDHFEAAPALGLFGSIGAMRDKFDKLRFAQPRFRHRCQPPRPVKGFCSSMR